MSNIFTKNYRTRYSEINASRLLDPADCARYVIDTAYYWADSMGLSEKFSDDKGLYWVIHETEIQFLEPLHFMDEFDLAIWMPEWKRVRGTRAFIVKRKSDQGLVARGFQ